MKMYGGLSTDRVRPIFGQPSVSLAPRPRPHNQHPSFNLILMGGETTSTNGTDSSQEWKIPELNLVMKNLSDPTSQKILSHFTPYTLIHDIVLGVLKALYHIPTDTPKDVKHVTIVFRNMDGIAYTTDAGEGVKEIHMSLDYFAGAGDRFEDELKGVLWHEMVCAKFFLLTSSGS